MKQTYSLSCIKCSEKYESNDPDPYFCEKCKEKSKAIAKDIDKKFSTKPRRQLKSDLQIFDELRRAKGSNYINMKDLGIKF